MNEVKNKWRAYIKRSNEPTFLRDVPNLVLRGPSNSDIRLEILRNGKAFFVNLKRDGRYRFDYKKLYFQDKLSTFQLLNNNIGYIKLGELKPAEVDSAMKTMRSTKAIIFDIRDYPKGTAEILASMIACESRKAVMHESPYVTSGFITGKNYDSTTLVSYKTLQPYAPGNCYKGRIVILVNEMTQSAGEHSAMLLQAASLKATVVGSQTAGADGGVVDVVFPGGYSGFFTGTGVKYPDGRQTQRTGIKIDIEIKPTIAGFMSGKDEVLLRAIEFIEQGK